MSASLVGSEMCIRDSPPRTPTTTRYHRRRTRTHTRPYPRTATRTTPVSYTHLTLPTICSV
eukprot:6526431-Alexandrium_andersonii.AAC.1